jgi:hypothetical protein
MARRPLPTLIVTAATTAVLALASSPAAAEPPCGTDNLLAGKKPQATQDVKGDTKLMTDGIAAPEGSAWDAPIAVTLTTPAAWVTYDLGEVRTISAAVLQGDANDVYKVSGSADGAPGSYKPLGELANVVGTGHGLRTRAVQFDAAKVRYLRVGESTGDNFYSISEFAAYCKAPTPFPPPMRVVDVPPAPGAESQATPKPGKDTGPAALLLTIIALALVYLAWKMVLPRAAEPPTDATGKDEDEDGEDKDKEEDKKVAADKDAKDAKGDKDETDKDKPGKDAPGDKPTS